MQKVLDVFTTSSSISEEDIRGKTVVVIDVLRATSTILTAISNGAKSVIPVEDMGAAGKIATNLDASSYILCGEKDGKQIDGYELGNSPFEYTEEVISGKTLILNTTNGTKALVRCTHASKVYIAAFLNVKAVCELLKEETNEISIVCSGWKGRLSLEDVLCAGYIVHQVYDGVIPEEAKDGAKVAMGLYERFGTEIDSTVHSTNHAKRLIGLGFESDIAYCCEVDKFNIVPEFKEGIIRK
jgi:2-phosphosulfolactate phosphatase